MEKMLTLQKTFHALIDYFIEDVENIINLKRVDKDVVFIELAKRSASISQKIRTVALSFIKLSEATGIFQTQDTIHRKISELVEECFCQDLIECALKADFINAIPSNDELHDILFKFCVNDPTSFTPLFMNFVTDGSENEMLLCHSSLIYMPHINAESTSKLINMVHVSSPLVSPHNSLEEEILHIMSPPGSEIPNNCSKSKREEANFREVSNSTVFNSSSSQEFYDNGCDWIAIAENKTSTGSKEIPSNILSWERQTREYIPCHLYTSELTDEEFLYNVTNEDSGTYRTLYSSTGIVSDADLIHDLLDLLVAIPSTTFMFDEQKQAFQVKPFSRRAKMSYESTLRFCETFVQCGTVFHKLKEFGNFSNPVDGYIMRGLKFGVRQIIFEYMKYIMSIKSNKPTLQMLGKDVLENSQLLNCVARICGITYEGNTSHELPKGLGLLSFLNYQSQLYKCKDQAIIISVLQKYTYSSYFNFLSKWMAEGICCDHFNEFQIMEKQQYLNCKNELYWKSAYTEYKSCGTRAVPPELTQFSDSILQCGKTVALLRNCSAQCKSQNYQNRLPPPPLTLLFSWPAIIQRNDDCESYIKGIDAIQLHDVQAAPRMSEDDVHIQKQSLLKQQQVAEQVEKRWNWYLCLRENLADSTKSCKKNSECLRKCKSLEDLSILPCHDVFSGTIFNAVGILFSMSGYSAAESNGGLRLHKVFRQNFSHNFLKKSNFFPDSPTENLPTPRKTTTGESELGISNTSKSTFGSFVDSLLNLLVSSYEESKEDIYSYVQMMSVRNLLRQNIFSVLKMRVHLVQKDVEDYIINRLRLKDLILCLKNTYFLQDESFSQSLCKKLFKWTLSCNSLESFTDWVMLNDILLRAISSSSLSNVPFLNSASVILPVREETTPRNIYRNKFLYYFHYEYSIDWPLNIIINETCISKYASIFSMILEMQYLCWLLGKVWRTWFIDSQKEVLQNSPQYRKVMLQRFDMHQFVRVLLNCIHQDLGGPLWESLEKDLGSHELSIDALQEIHLKYLHNALERCFLVGETLQLYETLDLLFDQVHKFCDAAADCTWDLNPATKYAECSNFEHLCDFYEMYLKCKKSFYDCALKMVTKIKIRKHWNVPFRQYLESILETGRNLS